MAAGWFSRLLGKAASHNAGQSSFRTDDEVVSNIDTDHLLSILENSSKHAGQIYEWLTNEYRSRNWPERSSAKRAMVNQMRKAVTLRDSLSQVAALVRGEELAEPSPREWPWEQQEGSPQAVLSAVMESPSVDTDEPALTEEETQGAVTTYTAPLVDADEMALEPLSPLKTVVQLEQRYKLREADIYTRVKNFQRRLAIQGLTQWADDLQPALDFIKEEEK